MSELDVFNSDAQESEFLNQEAKKCDALVILYSPYLTTDARLELKQPYSETELESIYRNTIHVSTLTHHASIRWIEILSCVGLNFLGLLAMCESMDIMPDGSLVRYGMNDATAQPDVPLSYVPDRLAMETRTGEATTSCVWLVIVRLLIAGTDPLNLLQDMQSSPCEGGGIHVTWKVAPVP